MRPLAAGTRNSAKPSSLIFLAIFLLKVTLSNFQIYHNNIFCHFNAKNRPDVVKLSLNFNFSYSNISGADR